MIIKVTKDKVSIEQNKLNHYGEYNVNECNFEFDEHFNSVLVKRAIFTSKSTNKTIEIDIINNKCVVPSDILLETYDQVTLGVYGYDTEGEELLIRYSPEPTYFTVQEGSYREGAEQPEIITPTQYDMYSKALQEGLAEVDKRLDDVEKQGNYASEQGNYAKQQGDYAKEQGNYAKEQKIEVVKANEEANRIINNFETNVSEYTTAFNENANNKTSNFDSNVESKTSDFNQNFDNKISEYNNNASKKLSAYNTNAENKKSEFDTNVANQTKTFNDNASDRLVEYNQNDTTKTNAFNNNATNKTNTFNSNANSKTETYNNNHTEKLNAYNTNADTKLQEYNDNTTLKEEEYNSNATAKMEEFNQIASDYDQRITANEEYLDTITPKNIAKGELVHITDALPLATSENKVSGNVKQETTKGNQLFDGNNPTGTNLATVSLNKNILSISSNATNTTPFARWEFNVNPNDVIRYSTIIQSVNGQALFQGYNGTWETINETVSKYTDGTTPSKKTYTNTNYTIIRIMLYSSKIIPTTNSESIYKNTIVTINNEDMTWEKFTNGASPNPDYSQPISVIEGSVGVKVNGKNFFKNKPSTLTIHGLTMTNDGATITIKGTNTSSSFYPSFTFFADGSAKSLNWYADNNTIDKSKGFFNKVGNKYMLSIRKEGSVSLDGLEVIEGYESNSYSYLFSKENSISRKLISDDEKLNFVSIGIKPNQTVDVTLKIQVDLGEVETDYEPYKEQIVPLDLKGNWVGKIKDTDIEDYLVTDKKNLWLVKNIGKYTLPNAYSLISATLFGTPSKFCSFEVPNVLIKSKNYNFVCDRVHKANEQYSTYGGYLNNNTFIVMVDENETLESFNAKMNGATLYYATATTETIDLGELPEPIKTFEGVNNIQVLANLDTEIEVTYGLDVKKYFDNKLAEISAQII